MAAPDIRTYAGVKAFVARTLRRTDLDDDIPVFVTLAEAQMQRRLRTGDMLGRVTATIDGDFVPLPTDFAGLRTLDLDTNPPTALDFIGAADMVRRGAVYFSAGSPSTFNIVGNQLQFSPGPDADFTARMTYWKRIPALSDAAPTNWLLTNHPDAYLYGALVQSAPFLKNDDRIPTWATFFTTAMSDIETDDSRRNYGSAPVMRARSLG